MLNCYILLDVLQSLCNFNLLNYTKHHIFYYPNDRVFFGGGVNLFRNPAWLFIFILLSTSKSISRVPSLQACLFLRLGVYKLYYVKRKQNYNKKWANIRDIYMYKKVKKNRYCKWSWQLSVIFKSCPCSFFLLTSERVVCVYARGKCWGKHETRNARCTKELGKPKRNKLWRRKLFV